ncbi:MAG: hypothetical protein ACPG1A_07455 [Halioglobus sp.]
MKRLDDGKVSLVEFMRSIRFARRKEAKRSTECETHFAHFDPQARPEQQIPSAEEQNVVRSAN